MAAIEDLVSRAPTAGLRRRNWASCRATQWGRPSPILRTDRPTFVDTRGDSPGLERRAWRKGPNGSRRPIPDHHLTGVMPREHENHSKRRVGTARLGRRTRGRATWIRSKLIQYESTSDRARHQDAVDDCLAAGGLDPVLCGGFSRNITGNLNPASNFLQNFGTIETDGVDLKANWASPEWGWGSLTTSVQATYINDYTAVDQDGITSPRQVGIEVNDSAIPEWQANMRSAAQGRFDAFMAALHRSSKRTAPTRRFRMCRVA